MAATCMNKNSDTGRERAVSEVIGAIMLISVVVVAVAVIGVALTSQGTPENIPALDAIISNYGNTIQIYHNGGDTLQRDQLQILVDGNPTTFTKGESDTSWTSWSAGDSLVYTVPVGDMPKLVNIVFKGAGASTILTTADFSATGMINEGPIPTSTTTTIPTPTPIITHTITASAGAGGSISPSGSITVPDGSSQTFTFIVSSGYHIADVVIDSTSQGAVPSYTFTNVLAAHTISVTFAVDAPTFGIISPPIGRTLGGTAVTITGSGFTGATAVTFGGTAATSFMVVSGTSITATTPFHAAGAVDVVVTTPGGTATGTGAYTYTATAAPTFTSIAPAAGPIAGGTTVIITGTNFVAGGSLGVTIGGVAATGVVRNSATQITAVTPAGTVGAKDVVITNSDGQTVTRMGAYTYASVPTFTSIAPAAGPTAVGTRVTITGTNFVTAGTTTVTLGGTAATAVTVDSATQITATAPAHAAGLVNVVVTTPGGTATGTNAYTYTAAPTFTLIATAYGRINGGTSVTITGTNFITGATAVTFGGTAATTFTVVSATSITATTPAHAAGAVTVVVTTPGGAPSRTYTYADPTISGALSRITGTRGSTYTGITIPGSNFINTLPNPTVTFTQGSNTMTGTVTACTATQVTFSLTIPAGQATGSYSVTITNNDGGAATRTSAFSVT